MMTGGGGMFRGLTSLVIAIAVIGALAMFGFANFPESQANARAKDANTALETQQRQMELQYLAAEREAEAQLAIAEADAARQQAVAEAQAALNRVATETAATQAALQEEQRFQVQQHELQVWFAEKWAYTRLLLAMFAGVGLTITTSVVLIQLFSRLIAWLPVPTKQPATQAAVLASPQPRPGSPPTPSTPDPYADPAFRQWRIAQARRQEELTRQARQPTPLQPAPTNGHYPAPRPAVVAEKTITILNITDAMLPYPYPYTNGNGHATNGHATNGHSAAPYVNGGPYMN